MSSTNRGAERRPADYYPTPSWCTRRLLEAIELPGGTWFEPAAGQGHIISAVQRERSDVKWHAAELRECCSSRLAEITEETNCPVDFLQRPIARSFDVVITNPPFSHARQFVERSLPLGDWVVMFLRLNFLGSSRRNSFFRQQMPDVYIVPDRPSFTTDGRTDSIEYAWFVWRPGERERVTGSVTVLPTTPLDERRRTRSPG